MKTVNLLVWLTQLGISVAMPPVLLIWLAGWLQERFNWGSWVMILGAALGIFFAIDGLRFCLKALGRMAKDKKEEQPPVCFNDHE